MQINSGRVAKGFLFLGNAEPAGPGTVADPRRCRSFHMFIMLALLFILSVPVLFAREPSFKILMTLGAMVLALALAPHANAAAVFAWRLPSAGWS